MTHQFTPAMAVVVHQAMKSGALNPVAEAAIHVLLAEHAVLTREVAQLDAALQEARAQMGRRSDG